MHGAERLRAELLRGERFDRFFDRPLDAIHYFRSHRGFEASIFDDFSTSGGFEASIFDDFSTSGGLGASIFEHFRRQEASKPAFSSIFDARRLRSFGGTPQSLSSAIFGALVLGLGTNLGPA